MLNKNMQDKPITVDLEPELDACVETQARRRYNQVLSELVDRGARKGLTEQYEILRLFLETADFNKLRQESEKHLVEGKKVRFILRLEDGKVKYEMMVK